MAEVSMTADIGVLSYSDQEALSRVAARLLREEAASWPSPAEG